MRVFGAVLCAASGYAAAQNPALAGLAFALGVLLIALPQESQSAAEREQKLRILMESNEILEREVASLQRILKDKDRRIEELTRQNEALRSRLSELIAAAEEQGDIGILVDELQRGYEAVKRVVRGDVNAEAAEADAP